MRHLDLFSFVTGETIELLRNGRSLATGHQGVSVHLGPLLPRSILLCLDLWGGGMNLTCTLGASQLGSASSAAMWSNMQL